MSISVNASSTLNPALAAMLSQLTPSNSSSASSAQAFSPASSSAPATGVATGSGKAQVSSDILNLFSQMHQAAGGTHAGGGAGAGGSTSTISSASTMMSPLDQLMAAIDMTDDTEDGASSTQTQYVDPNSLLPDQSS